MLVTSEWLDAASGRKPVDLVLKNARLVNVFSGSVHRADVGIFAGRFVGTGSYKARRYVDLKEHFLAPGFIDGHCHLESTMLSPREFARAVIPHGTTGVVADPHEIANVMGLKGIRTLVEGAQDVPFRFYFTLPSCVPATHLETAGATLTGRDLSQLLREPWAVGLGEMMNAPGVIHGDEGVIDKLNRFRGSVMDGHAPEWSGEALNAYVSCGISSDHECLTLHEAREKLERGMWIMIRQGSTAKNLKDLVPLVNERTVRRCLLVTDDRTPEDLVHEGHLDAVLAEAMEQGVDPVLAIQMVTLNPAEYFGLRELGAVAPGYWADAVVLEKLRPPSVEKVLVGGSFVYEGEKGLKGFKRSPQISTEGTFRVADLHQSDLEIAVRPGRIRVIERIAGQIITRQKWMKPLIQSGLVVSDPSRDLLKIVVVERHRRTGRIGIGFVRGFGLKDGALASSVAHDSHNMVAVGVDDRDLLGAVQCVIRMEGGLAVYENGKTVESLPLPIGGLMSTWGVEKVAERHRQLCEAAERLGCTLGDPFMALSFLALPVIPDLKITDHGLVDVNAFQVVDLFEQ